MPDDKNNINIYYCYDWRDPICVSHYPLPENSPNQEKIFELISLNHKSKMIEPQAFYVHIPFCDKICSFCPFNRLLKTNEKVEKYLTAIKKEVCLYADSEYVKSLSFGSLYFGGGTPTSLTKEQLIELIIFVKNKINLLKDAQISVEGSPANFTDEKLTALHEIGVNRVSFGIQTFNKKSHQFISLPQSTERNIEIIKSAHAIGFDNVCIDLLYNLPGQTVADWEQDVRLAIELGVEHITLFSLCLVPGTKLEAQVTKGDVPAPEDQYGEIDKFIVGRKILRDAGYIQYSVWDFARPGCIDKHVIYYYTRQQNLVGTGPAAFGYLNGYMYINKGSIDEYVEAINSGYLPIIVGEKATCEDKMRGMMAKGLRLNYVDKNHFQELFGKLPENVFPDELNKLESLGLITISPDEIRLTDAGNVWGNNVCKTFFAKPETFEWRASLAKGRIPIKEVKNKKDELLTANISWVPEVEVVFERILERKPMFIRNKARKDIFRQAAIRANNAARNTMNLEDLVYATLITTPAPFRSTAISGFREVIGIDIDDYLAKVKEEL